MTAFNVVRFRVKPGREQEFLDAHRNVQTDWPGLRKINTIKSGDRSYSIIDEWADMPEQTKPSTMPTDNSLRLNDDQRHSQRAAQSDRGRQKTRRSKLLKMSGFGDFLRSTLSWWRSIRISASSEALDRNNPMAADQISAPTRQLDRVYGRHSHGRQPTCDPRTSWNGAPSLCG
jgi:hypothetical protein